MPKSCNRAYRPFVIVKLLIIKNIVIIMKRVLFFAIAVMSFAVAFAQPANVTIKGTASNADGKVIQLFRYSDAISMSEVLLATDTIRDGRAFELKAYFNYPALVFLQVENYSQSFYIEPSRTYEVAIPQFDWNLDEKENIYLAGAALPVVFQNLPTDDINFSIARFDSVASALLQARRHSLDKRYRPNRKVVDTLIMEIEKQAPETQNQYFNRYREYKLAEIRFAFGYESRKKMVDRYISQKPILYYDENYMSLFTSIFSHVVSKGMKNVPIERLSEWIDNLDVHTYIDSIGTNELLRHEQVRELAAIIALKESYYDFRNYNSTAVIEMLKRLVSNTKFKEHKPIVDNLVKSFERAQDAATAKVSLELPDVDKNMVSLDRFRGKWVYLSFVRVGEPSSLSEIETMAHFYDTITKTCDLDFVTISCDREFQKFYHFLRNSKNSDKYTRWTWLHFNNNFELLRQFSVYTFPRFVLIDPEGRVQTLHALMPAEGFLVAPLIKQKDEKGMEEIKYLNKKEYEK